MVPRPAIGIQSFETIRERNVFYVDKTDFIQDWWEQGGGLHTLTDKLYGYYGKKVLIFEGKTVLIGGTPGPTGAPANL